MSLVSRLLVLGFGSAMLFAVCVSANAQQTKKMPRIGYLGTGSRSSVVVEAFQQELRDLGYIEGQNITIEYRSTEGIVERLPNVAAELVELNVDIIATIPPNVLARADRVIR